MERVIFGKRKWETNGYATEMAGLSNQLSCVICKILEWIVHNGRNITTTELKKEN